MTFGVLRCGPSFDHNVLIGNAPFETAVDRASDRRSTNAWRLLDLLYRLLEESPDTPLIRVPRPRKFHGHCKQVCSVEPRLDCIEEQEAPDHQPRASQQNNGECELGGDQQAARAVNACADRSVPAAFIQTRAQIPASDL